MELDTEPSPPEPGAAPFWNESATVPPAFPVETAPTLPPAAAI